MKIVARDHELLKQVSDELFKGKPHDRPSSSEILAEFINDDLMQRRELLSPLIKCIVPRFTPSSIFLIYYQNPLNLVNAAFDSPETAKTRLSKIELHVMLSICKLHIPRGGLYSLQIGNIGSISDEFAN